ncbi:hypothetical protein QBC44DRAFT_17933 [Cladorrhinum sp. PSN332]|nr:hypothetical protein QBC44DRAFT_17933 [Cladorrhinum sp. PSN332]
MPPGGREGRKNARGASQANERRLHEEIEVGSDPEVTGVAKRLKNAVLGRLNTIFKQLNEATVVEGETGNIGLDTVMRKHLRDYPVVSEQDLDNMLGPTINDAWTQEEEDHLQMTWQSHPMKAVIEGLKENATKELLVLWKCVVQYFKVTPVDIISPRHKLAFDHERVGKEGSGVVVWPSTFAKAFSQILVHPLWNFGHLPTFVMVLQFAVIVRTHDKRPWHFRNPTTDHYLGALEDLIHRNNMMPRHARTDMPALVLRARQDKLVRDRLVSPWYLFFEAIVASTDRDDLPSILDGDFERRPYKITTKDHEVIRDALNMQAPFGAPAVFTSDLYRQMFGVIRKEITAPKGHEVLVQALCKAKLKIDREHSILRHQADPRYLSRSLGIRLSTERGQLPVASNNREEAGDCEEDADVMGIDNLGPEVSPRAPNPRGAAETPSPLSPPPQVQSPGTPEAPQREQVKVYPNISSANIGDGLEVEPGRDSSWDHTNLTSAMDSTGLARRSSRSMRGILAHNLHNVQE